MIRHAFVTVIVAAVLALGACAGGSGESPPVSDEIPRPASLDGVDPQVVELIEEGIKVIEEDPSVALPHAGLGMMYQAHGMFEPARIAYRQALAIEPVNARWLYHLARVEQLTGEVDAAIETIGQSIVLEPRYAPSYWRRGNWYLSLDDLGAAEADFTTALELAPGDAAAQIGMARVRISQRREQEAERLLETVLLELPDDPPAHRLLGEVRELQGKTAEAERHRELARVDHATRGDEWTDNDILRFKLDFASHVQLAATLASAGRVERALVAFESLREQRPSDARLLLHLGRTYLAANRLSEGLATLERGVELHPRDPALLGETAAAYHGAQQPERALELLERQIEIKPHDGLAHARRGAILQGFKQYREAAESHSRALTYRPRDTRVMRLLAECLGHLRQYEAAAATYQQVLSFGDLGADVFARLGFMLHRLGRFADAEAALIKALDLEPDHADWSRLLEDSRARQG